MFFDALLPLLVCWLSFCKWNQIVIDSKPGGNMLFLPLVVKLARQLGTTSCIHLDFVLQLTVCLVQCRGGC